MTRPPNNPFEKIADPTAEKREIKELAALTTKLLDKRYSQKNKKVLRGVHPKSHGCFKAVFEVRQDIPEALRVGLFAEPGKRHAAWVRFSNAAIKVAHDLGSANPEQQSNGSRGMAIKVLDVKGRVMEKDDGASNQDFLMINTPAFAFIDSKQYLPLNQALDKLNDDEETSLKAVLAPLADPTKKDTPEFARAAKTLGVVKAIGAKAVTDPTEVAYFGAAPFLFGPDHVMRFKAEPWGGETPQEFPASAGANYLRQAARRRLRKREDVCFDFKLQVRHKSESNLQIEDATAVWDEAETPFVSVARLVIHAPQERPGADQARAAERREARCERMAFTPWHCLAVHQPLGSINRLRKAVYDASAEKRGSSKSKPKPKRVKLQQNQRRIRRRAQP